MYNKLIMETVTFIPFDAMLHIAELSPDLWVLITRILPSIGKYSLNQHTQQRMKNTFTITRTVYLYGDRKYIDFMLPNGKRHRDNEPAYIVYSEGGHVEEEVWYKDGEGDREGKPASICYNDDGTVKIER